MRRWNKIDDNTYELVFRHEMADRRIILLEILNNSDVYVNYTVLVYGSRSVYSLKSMTLEDIQADIEKTLIKYFREEVKNSELVYKEFTGEEYQREKL